MVDIKLIGKVARNRRRKIRNVQAGRIKLIKEVRKRTKKQLAKSRKATIKAIKKASSEKLL